MSVELEASICVGGPWEGWAYYTSELENRQLAAEWMEYPFQYERTSEFVELADEAPVRIWRYVEPDEAPERKEGRPSAVVLARYSGYCPLCGRYIAKSRSWVTALDTPVEPRMSWDVDAPYRHHTNYGTSVDGRGGWRDVRSHARTWVHAKCAV